MSRDVSVPLVLWVCAAVVFHLVGGGGAVGATIVEEKRREERADIRAMVKEVRKDLDVVELEIDPSRAGEPPEADPPLPLLAGNPLAEALDELVPFDQVVEAARAALLPQPEPSPEEEKKPEPEAEKPAAPEPEPEVAKNPEPEKAPEDPAQKPQELVVLKDQRIAVRQVVQKNQADNPDAPRIADDANKVDEETQARIRSTDQVSKDPSAGSNTKGPADSIGNDELDRTAQSEERPGDETKAPGEAATASTSDTHHAPKPAERATAARSGGDDPARASAPGGRGGPPSAPAEAMAGNPGGAGPQAPETATGAGDWSLDPQNPGGDGSTKVGGLKRPSVAGVPFPSVRAVGLGAGGLPGGAPSLGWQGFEKAVGEDQLRAEREAAGRSIRSKHRGRFDTDKFQRWLPDIENYDPTVKVGNQTALNAARVPFASYLSSIHNRIHPIFADEFLSGLDRLDKGHTLNQELVTHVEIILSRDDGKVVRMGVTKNSGSTMFDAAALEAIERASPFGKAPDVIVSPDNHVYLHWEFHRDPVDACSTRNARPFLVKDPKPLVPNIPRRPKPKRPKGDLEGLDDGGSGPILPLRRP